MKNKIAFRSLIEMSPDMETLSNRKGEIVYGSPSITTVLGYETEEFLNLPVTVFLHPEDIAGFLEKREQALNTAGSSFHFEQRCLHKNGTWIWCEGIVTNMLDEPGVHAMVSNFRDISEKKALEQQQQFDRNNLIALINNTSDLMWSVDMDYRLITFNQPFREAIRAISGSEITQGDDAFSFVLSNEQHNKFKTLYARALDGETFSEIEYMATPVESWSEISFSPIRKGTEVVGAACHSRNITELKINERTIKDERILLTTLIDSLPALVYCKDTHSVKTLSNRADREFLGAKSEEDALGKDDSYFFSDETVHETMLEDQEVFATGRPVLAKEELRKTKDGTEIWLLKSKIPIRNQNGEITGLIGISYDITQRKLLELERTKVTNNLVQRNKDLQQFSYIVSHNLRAPVANIIAITTIINSMQLSRDEEKQMIGNLALSVRKLDEVIKDLSHILQVRDGILSEQNETVKLPELLADIQLSISDVIRKEGVQFVSNFELDELYTIKSYLQSIFFNLITNSIKYRQTDVKPIIEISTVQTSTGVCVKIKDNGLGIDMEKQRGQVFGLYRRFHSHVEGKGMGLYMVKNQVEILGGSLSVESAVNKGSIFTITLPLATVNNQLFK